MRRDDLGHQVRALRGRALDVLGEDREIGWLTVPELLPTTLTSDAFATLLSRAP